MTLPARRVGLSATLGDVEAAASYLTSGNPEKCKVVVSNAGKPELRLQVKAYVDEPDVDDPDALEGQSEGVLHWTGLLMTCIDISEGQAIWCLQGREDELNR